MNKIYKSLELLNLTSIESRTLFSSKTRDNESLKVWKDDISGVIYIEDYFTPSEDYNSGGYRGGDNKASYESQKDLERRLSDYKQFYFDSTICDFGCGAGEFVRKASKKASKVAAVELQDVHFQSLNKDGIACKKHILQYDSMFDTVFAFHTLEHLEDPLKYLKDIKSRIKSNGRIIVEVPHANDLLLSSLLSEEFKNFTLWSPHLLLHTRDSLSRFLLEAGFKDIIISGIQRYPLSNHLYWLNKGKPGGHKDDISLLDSTSLNQEYENALNKINQTDTLVATASV